MKVHANVETKVAQTAFCWLEYNYYGSESKAIKSLLKRKGTEQLNQDVARTLLATAVKVFERTKELRETMVRDLGKSSLADLTQDQFEKQSSLLETTLRQEFPDLGATIEYMLGMIWRMPYWR